MTDHLRSRLESLKYPMRLIDILLEGIARDDLEQILVQDSPGEPADILRMNLLGGLRSQGFVLEGKKGNPFVKIIDWVEPVVKTSSDEWLGVSREVLSWVESLPVVDSSFEEAFRQSVYRWRSCTPWPLLHESCWLDLWAYELGAKGKVGYFFQSSNLSAVVIRKSISRPRFSLFVLRLEKGSEQSLIDLGSRLSLASVRPVAIKHLYPENIESLRSSARGSVGGSKNCIYDVKWIATRQHMGDRSFKVLRSRQRGTEFRIDPPTDDMVAVLDEWKKVHSGRHRQLAMGRDYVALRSGSEGMRSFGSYRDGLPVSHLLFDSFSHREDALGHITEKSLNYPSMPGGKSGTSDWALFSACVYLAEQGIEYIHEGDMMQGGDRHLYEKKLKLAQGRTFISPTFTLTCPLSEYA